MPNQQVRAIYLFFLYSVLDESIAHELSLKTVAALKGRGHLFADELSNNPTEDLKGEYKQAPFEEIIRETLSQLKKKRFELRKVKLIVPKLGDFRWPEKSRLAVWARFQREAREDELTTMVWSQILGVSDEDLSKGASVSVGTIRLRTGNALKQLGRCDTLEVTQ